MKSFAFVIVVILVLIAGAIRTDATTVVRMSVEEMAVNSDLIVEGVVDEKASRWDESGRMIITETTVRVASLLKGKPMERIMVRTLGGEVGEVGMFVAGAPTFKIGDSALLMLERHPTRDWRVVGLYQGKFDLRADPRNGRMMAISSDPSLSMPLLDLRAKIANATGRP